MKLGLIIGLIFVSSCAAVKPLVIDLTTMACDEIVNALDSGISPENVQVACKDASGAVVNIVMSRKAYMGMKK